MKETMKQIRNQNADKSLLWFLRLTGVVLFALGVLKRIGWGRKLSFSLFRTCCYRLRTTGKPVCFCRFVLE